MAVFVVLCCIVICSTFVVSDENTPFEVTGKSFERWIEYNLSYYYSWGSNYTEDFDSGLLVTEDKLPTYTQEQLTNLLKEGVSRFLASLVGYKIFVVDHTMLQSETDYAEPIQMPDVTVTVDNSTTDVNTVMFHHVKLSGLANITALDFNLATTDAELFSHFMIHITTPVDTVIICGEHTFYKKEEAIGGTFCFQIINSTQETTYYAVREPNGRINIQRIHEIFKSGKSGYSSIIVNSSSKGTRSKELEYIHHEQLNEAIAKYYLIPVSSRIRSFAEKNGFLQMTQLFSRSYRSRISQYTFALIQQYIKNLGLSVSIKFVDDTVAQVFNVSDFVSNSIFKIDDTIERLDDNLVSNVTVNLHYYLPDGFLVSIVKNDTTTQEYVDNITIDLILKFSAESAKLLDLTIDDIKVNINFINGGLSLPLQYKNEMESYLLRHVFTFLHELATS